MLIRLDLSTCVNSVCVCGAKGKLSGGNKESARLSTECELAVGLGGVILSVF